MAFACVDVRYVARMHRLAVETSGPSGGRYIGVAETAWFANVTRAIKGQLSTAETRKVPTMQLPNIVIRIIALIDPAARLVVPDLGRFPVVDNSRTRKALGIEFIPVAQSAPAMAQSLVDKGLV